VLTFFAADSSLPLAAFVFSCSNLAADSSANDNTVFRFRGGRHIALVASASLSSFDEGVSSGATKFAQIVVIANVADGTLIFVPVCADRRLHSNSKNGRWSRTTIPSLLSLQQRTCNRAFTELDLLSPDSADRQTTPHTTTHMFEPLLKLVS
jgi:hypothetical protein